MILCGGLGTRLGAVVADRAKPMADVGGRPFLRLLVDWLEGAGFARFVLAVGHRADTVRACFKGPRFLFSEEASPLGTAGALKRAAPLCRPGTLLVLNGDSYCPLDLVALLAAHRRAKALATIAVAPAGERRDGGIVEFSADGRVTAFREKAAATGASPFINAGVYALEPEALAAVPAGRPCSLERELFPALARLYAFPVDAPLYDIGTPERLAAFRAAWRHGLS